MPYVGAVAAFLYARINDADRPRPYRVPGGMPVARLLAYVCIAILLLSIILFMYVPGSGLDVPVVVGSIVSIILGEAAIYYAEHQRKNPDHAE